MPYLDTNKQFYDYGTATIDGNNVIDTTTTGVPYYNDFLRPHAAERLKLSENLVGSIQYMTPLEYYEECAKYGFDKEVSVAQLKQGRAADTKIIEHLKDVLLIYKRRFPLPFIHYAHRAQEGLHRFYVIGELYGWTTHKYPVLVINWADEKRANDEAQEKEIKRISKLINKAIKNTLEYQYTDIDEVFKQLQDELDDVFRWDDTIDVPVKYTTTEYKDHYKINIEKSSGTIDKAAIDYKLEIDEEDLLDDVDYDAELEDFMQRYFGDNWKTTNIDTYNKLKNEALIPEGHYSSIAQMDKLVVSTFGSNSPGTGCIFIHPSGAFLNIYPKMDDHEDLCYWLEDQGYNVMPDASWITNTLNYIRCRNSPHLCFVELPERVTKEQLIALEDWLYTHVTGPQISIETTTGEHETYDLNEYFVDEIYKIIRRYYSSGVLYR